MDQPKIPTLKDSQKPQVKVRGIGIGLTLAERLKQFKKKDLAFILAGLGVLFMAPLAEHFMMAPESADGTLQAGWKGGSGSGSGANGVFGGGGSPYDRTDGLAPGSPTGGGSDVITPLNVRDPSALVMGPGGTQQPPTNSALPATPPVSAPSSRSDSDLKDALAASARGVGAAAKKAALPVPKIAVGGSGLRGLGVAGGGSSSSASLGPISAGNVPNRAAGGDSTGNARSTKGYSGVQRGQSSGGGGMEALKAAAGKQAENMNRGTGAATDLNAAAQTAIPTGGDGRAGGGPGAGKEDKAMAGTQDKGSKTIGESLDFINKKERMQKDLELEYKKKEANDMGLLWANMRNEGLKTVFGSIAKSVGDGIGKCIGGFMGGEPCIATPGDSTPVIKCATPPNTTLRISDGYTMDGSGVVRDGKGNIMSGYTGCVKGSIGGKDSATPTANPDAVTGVGGVASGDMAALAGLGDVCRKINDEKANAITKDSPIEKFVTGLETEVKLIAGAQVALLGGTPPSPCQMTPVSGAGGVPVKDLLKDSIEALGGLGATDGGVIKSVKEYVGKGNGANALNTDAATPKLEAALTANNAISRHLSTIVVPAVPQEISANVLSNQRVTKITAGMATAKGAVEAMVTNLDSTRGAINTYKKMIDEMVPNGTLYQVQEKNRIFTDEVKAAAEDAVPPLGAPAKEGGGASGEGTTTAPAGNQVAHGSKDATTTAIEAVTTPLDDAKSKIKAYVDEPEPKKKEALKAPAETAIKAAEKAIMDMRAAQTNWASYTKTNMQTLEKFVVEAKKP